MLQAGIDEVGYGSGFGDLTLALVVIEEDTARELKVKDSKKLSPKKREELYDLIIDRANYYFIVSSSAEDINNKGIIECWKELAQQLYSNLRVIYPDLELHIDGSSHIELSNTTYLHKGDDLIPAISCASIIAKVHRDRQVVKQQRELDIDYDIESNKGYLTVKHLKALKQYGPSKYHRTKYIRNHI